MENQKAKQSIAMTLYRLTSGGDKQMMIIRGLKTKSTLIFIRVLPYQKVYKKRLNLVWLLSKVLQNQTRIMIMRVFLRRSSDSESDSYSDSYSESYSDSGLDGRIHPFAPVGGSKKYDVDSETSDNDSNDDEKAGGSRVSFNYLSIAFLGAVTIISAFFKR